MTRFRSTLWHDVRLQWRNGFYLAAGIMLALFLLLLGQLPARELSRLLPAVVVNNVIVNGFYFVAGLVLLEKGEGSLQAQVVTPLRPWEYLGSKALSLTVLSLLENGLLTLVLLGANVRIGWLLLGIAGGTGFFALSGFLVVVRYEAVNDFLLPSLVIVSALTLPLLPYFGVGDAELLSTLLYLHPLQAVLLALGAASGAALAGWQVAYVVLCLMLVTTVTLHMAQTAYGRYVRQGTLLSGGRKR